MKTIIKPILLDLPMPIMTPRLLIRPPNPGDGATLNAAIIESFDILHRFMDWAKEKPTVEESEERVREAAANWILKKNEDPWLQLSIFNKATDEFIGGTGFHHINWDVPSVKTGYWIRNSCSGQGLMTEAINALTQYAFKELKVKRIAITCDVENIRSQKIPKQLGYHLESVIKANRLKMTGEISDTLVFARHNLDGLPNLVITW